MKASAILRKDKDMFPDDTATTAFEEQLNAAYAQVEDARLAQRPPRGSCAYFTLDGAIKFAPCQHIKNYGASLNAETDERFMMQQLPSDGYAWIEEIGG
jgi:hypothetical protein